MTFSVDAERASGLLEGYSDLIDGRQRDVLLRRSCGETWREISSDHYVTAGRASSIAGQVEYRVCGLEAVRDLVRIEGGLLVGPGGSFELDDLEAQFLALILARENWFCVTPERLAETVHPDRLMEPAYRGFLEGKSWSKLERGRASVVRGVMKRLRRRLLRVGVWLSKTYRGRPYWLEVRPEGVRLQLRGVDGHDE